MAEKISTLNGHTNGHTAKYRSYARSPSVLNVPNLVQMQVKAFEWLKTEGIGELLKEVSPIDDFTGHRFQLSFESHEFRVPKYDSSQCREKETTFEAPLYITTKLLVKETQEIKEQTLFFGNLPIMTDQGTFVINGAERVVVSQLVRSPGAYFTLNSDPSTGRGLAFAKVIPYRGAWLEFETTSRDQIVVKVDRKRKAPVTTLLRAMGYVRNEDILGLFRDVDTDPQHPYLQTTLEKDVVDAERVGRLPERDLKALWERVFDEAPYQHDEAVTMAAARLEFYRKMRPGEPPTLDNANILLDNIFFNPRRYDLGRVGRYKIDKRLQLERSPDKRVLSQDDLIAVLKELILLNNGGSQPDDIDHLGNRRVRAVGELIQNQLRVGFLRMERVIKERMTIVEPESATPAALVNIRPVVAAIREFFAGSQLSQFMDQSNPLAELTHKRRLSALGPGGLSRERAGFEVRDVHHSHYGRICPIETPEGPNIGLLGSLATYARINDYGFLETPYRKVYRDVPNDDAGLLGRTLHSDVLDKKNKVVAKSGTVVDQSTLRKIKALESHAVLVRPFVATELGDIVYLPADEEERYVVAQANIPIDSLGQLVPDKVETRTHAQPAIQPVELVDLMDVSSMQIVSVSTALIPFLEHDDANRALMGSNMQRQAVPLIKPDAPLVSTGMEHRVALDSGHVAIAAASGVVTNVDGSHIVVAEDSGNHREYSLTKFLRSNQSTCINQRPLVTVGQQVHAGEPLADSSSTDKSELALGQNVLVAFMIWEGYNFEDAIIIGENLVRDDKFTSVHIEKYEHEARQTKLGDEEITRDIPNAGEEALRDLDEDGIIRVGAEVGPGDVLVGKITPKGETELTAEEKLLRAIFGEKARDVKDTSLRVPHGGRGKVINVRVSTRGDGEELPTGVNRLVRVWVAQTRKVTVGDKMAGRHGNKGVISRVLPVEDMPYLENGTAVEVILNPIGVPSRMNLGQVLETHLGRVAGFLGFRAVSPVFEGARDIAIEDGLARVWFVQAAGAVDERDLDNPVVDWDLVWDWLSKRGYDGDKLFDDLIVGEARHAGLDLWLREEAGIDPTGMDDVKMLQVTRQVSEQRRLAPPILGKVKLVDGRTGHQFDYPVTVGYIYMMKLIHLVEDKIHARSTGPYSLITQQPLGGKAQFGGQRFGEMEVWALEAYSAAYNLQEMLTVKSDDVTGRQRTYEAIVKGEDVSQPGVPESFHVLLKELQALGLSVELRYDEIEEEDGVLDAQDVYFGEEDIGEPLDTSALELAVSNLHEGGGDTGGLKEDDGDDENTESPGLVSGKAAFASNESSTQPTDE
jgi:DNA-directed RNA polymerase subunit beta